MTLAGMILAPAQTGADSPISTRTLIIVGVVILIGVITVLGYRARERSVSPEEENKVDD